MNDNTMIDLREMVTDADIMLVLNRVKPSDCSDPDYWFATVDLIEDGRSPGGNGMLTMSELMAWEHRVTKGQNTNDQDQTRLDVPADNDVPYGTSRENHRTLRQIHPSSSRSSN